MLNEALEILLLALTDADQVSFVKKQNMEGGAYDGRRR